jgi:hypothetical protein
LPAERRDREAVQAQVRWLTARHLHALHEIAIACCRLARLDVEVDAGRRDERQRWMKVSPNPAVWSRT